MEAFEAYLIVGKHILWVFGALVVPSLFFHSGEAKHAGDHVESDFSLILGVVIYIGFTAAVYYAR